MKKAILFSIIAFVLHACSSHDDVPVVPAPQQSTHDTITQDSRLEGGWRLDSTLEDTVITYGYPGTLIFTDSINLSTYNFNGNVPVSDFNYFVILQDSVWIMPSAYFWDTAPLDSMYIRFLNHSLDPKYRIKYYLSGNNLRLELITYINFHYSYIVSYYHR